MLWESVMEREAGLGSENDIQPDAGQESSGESGKEQEAFSIWEFWARGKAMWARLLFKEMREGHCDVGLGSGSGAGKRKVIMSGFGA